MSLDAETSKLTKPGTVTIYPDENNKTGCRIIVKGADGDNCTCRDIVVQSCLNAIGVLQQEVQKCIQEPGGGSIGGD